jgi:hypothetical protein
MIQEQNTMVWADFSGGRATNRNLTEMTPEQALIAANVLFLGDEAVSKRPGYTLKGQLPIGLQGAILALYDFQRDADQVQYLLAQVQEPGQPNSALIAQLGTNAPFNPTTLSATEDPVAQFTFEKIDYAAYMGNGVKAWKMVDVAGVPTLYKWGIANTFPAPTITEPAGTLTLTYGRQYVFCPVSKITDHLSITRVHVGPPSPISAHTGPQVNVAPTVALPTFTDPQVTHVWIFSSFDTPANTASVFEFNGEVTNGTASYADSVTDLNLDGTRLAPFGLNLPIPAGTIQVQFNSRMVIAGIPGQPNVIQVTGLEEISVGIPQECAPASLVFQIPGGKQTVSAGIVWNQTMLLSTLDYWFDLTGFDVETFQKQDKIAQPGAVGRKALVSTPRALVYVGKDKKIWAWSGQGDPFDISALLGKALVGSLSMEDIASAELPNCELRYYTYGRYNLLVLLANTGAAPSGTFDWIQIWDATFFNSLTYPEPGKMLEDNTRQVLAESDMFPSDLITTSAIVADGNDNYLFLGDRAGNIYRWPDGYTDNGKKYQPVWGSPWTGLKVFAGQMFHPVPAQNVVKKLGMADLVTDREDAAIAFKLKAVLASSPNMVLKPVDCPLGPLRHDYAQGADPTSARCNLHEVRGASVGQWARFFILFPVDDKPATVYRFSVSATPLYPIVP